MAQGGIPADALAGIRAVFVNGTAVARDGQHTGARPGRPLRHAGASKLA